MSLLSHASRQEFEAAEATLKQQDWTCPRCGHLALIEVLGSAHVVHQAHAMADGVAVRDQTRALAAAGAVADVARSIAVAQCPKCGTRDTAATWKQALAQAAPFPSALVLLGLLGLVVAAIDGGLGVGLTVLGGFATAAVVALAIAAPIARTRLLKRADLAVEFVLS